VVPQGRAPDLYDPFGHWNTQTFIAALRHDRLDAPWMIEGAMNRELFELYVETQLAPTLQVGDVVRPAHSTMYGWRPWGKGETVKSGIWSGAAMYTASAMQRCCAP